jgi:hypothetical protein
MANFPAGAMRPPNTGPQGQAIGAFDQGPRLGQQHINAALMLIPTAETAGINAVTDGARALQVASNTQEHQLRTAANATLNTQAAQKCCLDGRLNAALKYRQEEYVPAMYKLANLLSSA